MKALLLAAGKQARWVEGGGTGQKQLVEIDGEPVIRRSHRLISDRCPDVVTLVDKPSLRIWDGLNPRKPAHESWMGEMGKFLDGRPYWPKTGEVAILYGDVFYTEDCLDLIFDHVIDQPTIYGRAAAGRRLESFAIRFDVERDVEEVERVARECADHDLNNRGGPWRFFHRRHTGAKKYDSREAKRLATPENGWVETPDDETDDFDTPRQLQTWRERFRPTERKKAIMARKNIATERIYGFDNKGREVLVAAPGQPVPEGFRERAPAQDHSQHGPERMSQGGSELSSLTVPQLRELATRKGVETDGLRKAELIEALNG